LQDAIRNKNAGYIVNEAVSQVKATADVLDVNCGLPDVEEDAVLPYLIQEIQSAIDVPLQIDSVNEEALSKAARLYNGKPLINSVNGSKESLDAVLPIVKKYGAAVVGLTLDENGIPKTWAERVKIAKRIVAAALKAGIKKEDIFIDCLTLTVSTQQDELYETIKAVRVIKRQLGVKTVLGVSNVSFGLPNRPALNSTFLVYALSNGLDAAIMNPLASEMTAAMAAFRVLQGQDRGAKDYVETYLTHTVGKLATEENSLADLICHGQKEAAAEKVRKLTESKDPFKIIEEDILPAMEFGGREFDAKRLFLPQLIAAGETSRACLDVVMEKLPKENRYSKGKVVLATVKGDVHDIGKGIVRVLLEAYGFEVIDLGKDVPPAEIVRSVVAHSVRLVGLSALMTTTIASMKETISLLRERAPHCQVMVGGAVLNDEIAHQVGADFYGKHGRIGVDIAKKVLGT